VPAWLLLTSRALPSSKTELAALSNRLPTRKLVVRPEIHLPHDCVEILVCVVRSLTGDLHGMRLTGPTLHRSMDQFRCCGRLCLLRSSVEFLG
jgi:hypothetical protein